MLIIPPCDLSEPQVMTFPSRGFLGLDHLMNSSSSIDATSEPVLLNKENLQFVAAQSICLDRLVFDRRALPDGFQLQGPAALFQQPDI